MSFKMICLDLDGTLLNTEHRITPYSKEVLRQLVLRGAERLKNLFRGNRTRSEMVATFLALLELIKVKRITVDGEGDAVKVSMIPGASTELPTEVEME